MSNSWFQFKQFTIQQEDCAMKVSTDACIFGAWVSGLWKNKSGKVLDIGTGTGLLTLMLLQQNKYCFVVCLEPEKNAFKEAALNFKHSKWESQTSLSPKTLQDYAPSSSEKFDLIICNPPFFQNHLLGLDAGRNQARHDALTLEELAHLSREAIKESGKLAVIYPDNVWENWCKTAISAGWQIEKILKIQPSHNKTPNRICGIFSLQETEPIEQHLLIRDAKGAYTAAFKELLLDYYLYL